MERNILLVEDEEALRMTVGDRLRKEGYIVDSTGDGQTGFQKATSLPFDLMILDVMLPRRNGVDLCRDIRMAGLRTPVLMLSALRDTEDVITGFHAGADDYVTKPFDMLELMSRVETLLDRVPAGKHQSADSSPKISGQHSRVSRSVTSRARRFTEHPITVQDEKLSQEFCRRLVAEKNCELMAELASRLRKILDEAQQNPHAQFNSAFLGVAGGITHFLEEMLAKFRRGVF